MRVRVRVSVSVSVSPACSVSRAVCHMLLAQTAATPRIRGKEVRISLICTTEGGGGGSLADEQTTRYEGCVAGGCSAQLVSDTRCPFVRLASFDRVQICVYWNRGRIREESESRCSRLQHTGPMRCPRSRRQQAAHIAGLQAGHKAPHTCTSWGMHMQQCLALPEIFDKYTDPLNPHA